MIYILYLFSILTFFNQSSQKEQLVSAELISDHEAIAPNSEFWVGLKLNMKEGWYTYWRNPGDAGLPTSIDWDLPDGFQASEIYWPFPQDYSSEEIAAYGYKKNIILLTKITVPQNIDSNKIEIKAKANWLVCKEACLPGGTELKLNFNVESSPQINPEQNEIITQTKTMLPFISSEWQIETRKISKNEILLKITPPNWYDENLENIKFLPYTQTIYKHNKFLRIKKVGNQYKGKILLSDMRVSDPKFVNGILINAKYWDKEKTRKSLEIKSKLK